MSLDIDAARKLADAATDGPWAYNSYSAVFSTPKIQPHDDWLDTTGEHTLERRGECPACGEGSTGCALYSEDYTRDALVAHVPAHHGDTATGQRVADAEFIAAARALVPRLCDEVEALKAANGRLLDRCYTASPVLVAADAWADAHSDRDVELIRRRTATTAPADLYGAVMQHRAATAGEARSWSLPAEPNVDRLYDRHGQVYVRTVSDGLHLWWEGEPGADRPMSWPVLLGHAGELHTANPVEVNA